MSIRREADGVRLRNGVARFRVDKRAPGESPVRVFVDGGRIDVLGTDFTVEQSGARGQVTLHEGSIRFHADSGEVTVLRPGQRQEWPAATPAAAAPASIAAPQQSGVIPPASGPLVQGLATQEPVTQETAAEAELDRRTSAARARSRAPRPARRDGGGRSERARLSPITPTAKGPAQAPLSTSDLEAIHARLAELRSRGDFSHAAKLLRHALKSDLRGAAREQPSYELGSILTHHLEDAGEACAYWANYRGTYPTGRFEDEAKRAQESLQCHTEDEK